MIPLNIFKRTIANDITLRLFTFIVCVVIIISAIIYQINIQIAEEVFGSKAKDKMSSITSVLKEPVWNLDETEINRIMDLYLDTPEIIKIDIRSNYNNYSKKKQLENANNDFELTDKIFVKNILIGEVSLTFTKKFLIDQTRNSLYLMLMVVFVIIVFTVFSINFLLSRYLKTPFYELTEIINKITSGNYKVRGSSFKQEDINSIISGFNKMSHQLEIRDRELNSTREYLTNVIDSMSSVIISINEEGKVTGWNKAAAEFTKIRSEEALDKVLWQIEPIFLKYKKFFPEIMQTNRHMEFHRELFKKEKLLYENVSIYPLSPSGPKGLVLRLDDITELENKELQLRQAQKMETVGTLAGGLAHDFNNVLGGIIGTLSLIRFKLNSNQEIALEKLKEHITTMEESSQRAADMVQQLLALSRKKELSFAPVDLNLTIKHVNKICQNTFDKSIDLDVSYNTNRAMTSADPTQIEQMLLNLCVNAYHAMTIMVPQGEKRGGTLKVELEHKHISAEVATIHEESSPGNYWMLKVKDTGVGISSEIISKIFDPFYTTKEKNKGTGLGLAMVYNIIKQHKGFIEVDSELNKGTVFKVYLPVLERVEFQQEEETIESIPKGKGTILVVDDESIIRNLVSEILKECGYNSIFAYDGLEGLEIYKNRYKEIDLVILDMVMPRMSGKETYIEMKKINPDVKVLLVSGFKKDERVEEALSLGVSKFIQKPYTLNKMANTLHQMLNEK